MAIFLQKTKSTDTFPSFLANKKGVAESTRQLLSYIVLVCWYNAIIWEVTLKTVLAYW